MAPRQELRFRQKSFPGHVSARMCQRCWMAQMGGPARARARQQCGYKRQIDRWVSPPPPPLSYVVYAAGSLAVTSRTHRHRHLRERGRPSFAERITHAVKACYASSPRLQQVTAASVQNRAKHTAVLPSIWARSGNHARRAASPRLCASASTTLRPVPVPHVARQPPSHRSPRHPLNPPEEPTLLPLGAASRRNSSWLGLVGDARQH